jgi:hypothetical protein
MTGGEWPDARERQMTAKVETRAAAPSLSLRLLQGQGGDFDFEPSAAASVRAVPSSAAVHCDSISTTPSKPEA